MLIDMENRHGLQTRNILPTGVLGMRVLLHGTSFLRQARSNFTHSSGLGTAPEAQEVIRHVHGTVQRKRDTCSRQVFTVT